MGIRGRLAASHFVLVLTILLVLGLVLVGRVRAFILSSAEQTLGQQAVEVVDVLDTPAVARAARAGFMGGAGIIRLISNLTAADFLVVDSSRVVLAGSERLGNLTGATLYSSALDAALSSGAMASDTYRDPLGRLSVIAAAPFTDITGAVSGAVVLLRPVSEVTRTTGGLLIFLIEATLFGLALSLALSLLLARGLTRPLRALETASSRIAAGDFSQRVPVESSDELGRLASSFNAMAKRLGELQRERQDLYASVSHELRTPVTSIRGFAQALLDNVGGQEDRERHAAIIIDEAARLERLVNDLFQLSRLEAGQVTFEWRDLDLGALVQAAAGRYGPQAERAGVDLRVDPPGPGEPLPVKGDPDRLNQVMSNLIENALRFTPAGGTVVVRAGRDKGAAGQALVSVGDSGPGIPNEDLERVFDRFYTVDRSRARKTGGTGLGLAIAKEIIGAHGGRIWAGRSSEGGALVSFVLPLVAAQAGGGNRT